MTVEQPSESKSTSRLKKALFHASLTVKQKNKFGVFSNMTVRQAIDKYGIPARRAVMDELQQLIKLNVLKFHKPDHLIHQYLRIDCRARHLSKSNSIRIMNLKRSRLDWLAEVIDRKDIYTVSQRLLHLPYRWLDYISLRSLPPMTNVTSSLPM